MDRAEQTESGPGERARLLELRARAASRAGDVRHAHQLLLSAAELMRDERPGAALELYAEVVEGASYAGDLERLAEGVAAAQGLDTWDSPRQEFLITWLTVSGATMHGEVVRDATLLARVLAFGNELREPRLIVWAGICALNLGDLSGMLRCFHRALEIARSTGAAGSLPYALEYSAMSMALAARYGAARSAAEEGLALALETEQQRSASYLHAVLAFVHGTTGDEEACRAHADSAREISVPMGLALPTTTATWATARLDLAYGRHDAALDRLLMLNAARPDVGHPVVTLWSAPDLVEAAVRARRADEATDAIARLEQLAAAGGRPGAEATLAWCQGLLGGSGATDRLASAAETFRGLGLAFGEARISLSLGEMLRRDRQPRLARERLRVASEAFQQMGALPWAERAAAELRASGEAAPVAEPSALSQLTPQELQIVRYVAEGASNREVAAQLFISPRTVEYHLYKAYPKLGVSSRTQLVAALRGEPALAGSG